jgi:hypothetical protein
MHEKPGAGAYLPGGRKSKRECSCPGLLFFVVIQKGEARGSAMDVSLETTPPPATEICTWPVLLTLLFFSPVVGE